MRCPHCNHNLTRVLETRTEKSQKSIKRRRLCISCFKRFNTLETIEEEVKITTSISTKKRGRKMKKADVKGDSEHDDRLRDWIKNPKDICDLCGEIITNRKKQVSRHSKGMKFYFCCQDHFDEYFQQEEQENGEKE